MMTVCTGSRAADRRQAEVGQQQSVIVVAEITSKRSFQIEPHFISDTGKERKV
jgi:hypothetical protein